MNNNNPLTFNHRVSKLQNQQRKSRNYQHLKPAYQAMNWKNYTITRPRNISLQDADRLSNKNSVRQHQSPSYYQPQSYEQTNAISSLSQKKVRQENLRLSGVTYNNKRQQHATRVKQDAIRRVKMLQQKVLPLITNDKNTNEDQNEEYGFAWQLKMQQKLVKIQNSIQKVKNQIQIKYEKRLIDIERQWEQRISDLLDIISNQGVKNGSDEKRNIQNGQVNGVNGYVRNNYNEQVNFGNNYEEEVNIVNNNYEEEMNGLNNYDNEINGRGYNNDQEQVNGRNGYVYYRSGFEKQLNGNDKI